MGGLVWIIQGVPFALGNLLELSWLFFSWWRWEKKKRRERGKNQKMEGNFFFFSIGMHIFALGSATLIFFFSSPYLSLAYLLDF